MPASTRKKVTLRIDAPGSSGELTLDVTREQEQFLAVLVALWNDSNPLHAAPYLRIESHPGKPPRNT